MIAHDPDGLAALVLEALAEDLYQQAGDIVPAAGLGKELVGDQGAHQRVVVFASASPEFFMARYDLSGAPVDPGDPFAGLRVFADVTSRLEQVRGAVLGYAFDDEQVAAADHGGVQRRESIPPVEFAVRFDDIGEQVRRSAGCVVHRDLVEG